jgi:hypothetical protein
MTQYTLCVGNLPQGQLNLSKSIQIGAYSHGVPQHSPTLTTIRKKERKKERIQMMKIKQKKGPKVVTLGPLKVDSVSCRLVFGTCTLVV